MFPLQNPRSTLFADFHPLGAAPSSHNEEIIFYNVHYKIGNGLNYLSLQGLPFLWNMVMGLIKESGHYSYTC